MKNSMTFGDIHGAIIDEAKLGIKAVFLNERAITQSEEPQRTPKDYTIQKAKNHLKAIKKGGCTICGYQKCNAALQFHHKDPSIKLFALASVSRAPSWQSFIEEIAKCVLLCANCHIEVHAKVVKLK